MNEETLRQTANSQCDNAPDLTAVDDANVGHTFAARDAGDKIINASTKGDSSCHGTASACKVAQRSGNDTVAVTNTSDTRALAARGRARIRRFDVAVKAASEQSGVTADSTPFSRVVQATVHTGRPDPSAPPAQANYALTLTVGRMCDGRMRLTRKPSNVAQIVSRRQ